MKNQKGITLVALVITIIVLLILAGVSLSLVAGENGILGRATGAAATAEMAEAKQEIELAIADAQMSYLSDWTTNKNAVKANYFTNNNSATTGIDVYASNCLNASSITATSSDKTVGDSTVTEITVLYVRKGSGREYKAVYELENINGTYKFYAKNDAGAFIEQ